jgi:O-succinylbenzoic acid--CoA ligase
MTETITHIAVKKLNNIDLIPDFYQTLPNVTIYKDERNCLVIDAPKVSDKLIFTNDVVQLIFDTQFECLGRFDNVINSGGIKLHPEKIEEKLSEIIINRFFVTGIADEKLGEKLVLIVELENSKIFNYQSFLSEEIKKTASLSKFEIPKEIYFIANFLETETKKIQRKNTLDLIKL